MSGVLGSSRHTDGPTGAQKVGPYTHRVPEKDQRRCGDVSVSLQVHRFARFFVTSILKCPLHYGRFRTVWGTPVSNGPVGDVPVGEGVGPRLPLFSSRDSRFSLHGPFSSHHIRSGHGGLGVVTPMTPCTLQVGGWTDVLRVGKSRGGWWLGDGVFLEVQKTHVGPLTPSVSHLLREEGYSGSFHRSPDNQDLTVSTLP